MHKLTSEHLDAMNAARVAGTSRKAIALAGDVARISLAGEPATLEAIYLAGPEGRHAVRRGIDELIAAGIVTPVHERTPGGNFAGTHYVLTGQQ